MNRLCVVALLSACGSTVACGGQTELDPDSELLAPGGGAIPEGGISVDGGTSVPSGDCTPGESQACWGPGGCQGARVCGADGTWSACVCETSDGTGGVAGGTAVGPCGAFNPALTPTDGYILDIDGSGVLGYWYTFGSEGSIFSPAEGDWVAADASGAVCFRGEAAQVLNGDYAAYYGAEIGFDLCAMPAEVEWLPAPYNTWPPESQHTISECGISLNTISFQITGNLPPELRLVFWELDRDESPYLEIFMTGCFRGNAADATVAYDSSAPPLNLRNLAGIRWHVATNTAAPSPFDFCISEIRIQ